MIKKFSLMTAAIALTGSLAQAGSPEPASTEPAIAAPLAMSPNWAGFYIGAQAGHANIDATPGARGDGFTGGLTGGYDWDLGEWVVGVGADYDFSDIRVGRTDVESIWRLKFRGGYKLGNGLFYGTAGYAHADTDIAGDDNGYFVGAGYEHLVTQNFSLSSEVLYNDINGFGLTTSDLEIVTIQLRAAYHF